MTMLLHGLAVNFVFILKKDASFSTCDDAGGRLAQLRRYGAALCGA